MCCAQRYMVTSVSDAIVRNSHPISVYFLKLSAKYMLGVSKGLCALYYTGT